jgi:hypothetical protein
MYTQTARIAANCIRSLLLQTSPTAADLGIARYLFPRVVAFVTDTEPEDPERARMLTAQTLCLYVGTVGAGRTAAAMTMVIPTLLARAGAEGESVYHETSSRLLELAAVDQATFKAIVAGMSGSQKSFLEEVIRSGQQAAAGASQSTADGSGQPTITLKMNFGG